ncbi:3-oxoacid CoA-transferase subunit A [Paenarthrobacter nicotinovorans]|uniref:3-oxoacid CoA-transferase subunit A n=1 Tax=Paenarthrobacter nicotinovorans TaxID=29320 RepID=A0ABT9TN17_PAENI|nr:CoA transferase subunit A [Paenarthrobacter nicotinovorans]MDQ0103041.1 3-oxoacid CoA-transferase subunit A [Paenarthrobacter nicotinovorans]GAT89437.1 succinyl-CoA:3-ketoacid-CoA transferase [Paenarthrobacter nicotinovorans]
MSKLFDDASDAVRDIRSGHTIAVGGFGLCGIPSALINALFDSGTSGLEVVCNDCGTDDHGLGVLLGAGQISRVTASYVGENKEFARQYLSGELEVELTPQGTLAERLRSGGAGIGGFYVPAGTGTAVQDGGLPWRYSPTGEVDIASPPKEVRAFNGTPMVLETGIRTDFALVRAAVADTAGNARFKLSASNFNPLAAMAGRITILEAEEVVEAGDLGPDDIHLPGIFVQRIVRLTPEQSREKYIEKRTTHAQTKVVN